MTLGHSQTVEPDNNKEEGGINQLRIRKPSSRSTSKQCAIRIIHGSDLFFPIYKWLIRPFRKSIITRLDHPRWPADWPEALACLEGLLVEKSLLKRSHLPLSTLDHSGVFYPPGITPSFTWTGTCLVRRFLSRLSVVILYAAATEYITGSFWNQK